MAARFGIAEWYGNNLLSLTPSERVKLAGHALGDDAESTPVCPFQDGRPCRKPGGVCGLRRYSRADDRIGDPLGEMVVTCPRRFEQGGVIVRWLADIVGFDPSSARVASEVPLMQHAKTGKLAGKLDFVTAEQSHGRLAWHGLEVQAVYFSGVKMEHDFLCLNNDHKQRPPFPQKVRRPDWLSSSAKRLMPQLHVKGPTLRRWGAKLAVCVDSQFFDYIGGPSDKPNQDLDLGDVIWMVPELVEDTNGRYQLRRGHWEVMTLEDAEARLQSQRTVTKTEFEKSLLRKLRPVADIPLRSSP